MSARKKYELLEKTLSSRILFHHVNPPIPIRQYDFQAYRDGWEDGPWPVGWGTTPLDAMRDLLDREAEKRAEIEAEIEEEEKQEKE